MKAMLDMATKEYLDRRLRETAAVIDDLLKKRIDDIEPSMFVDGMSFANGRQELHRLVFEIKGSFNEEDEKHSAMHTIADACADRRCIPACAILVSEAWSSQRPPGEMNHPHPRDADNRIECIVAMGMTMTGICGFASVPIARVLGNQIAVCEPWSFTGATESQLLYQFFRAGVDNARDRMLRRGGRL